MHAQAIQSFEQVVKAGIGLVYLNVVGRGDGGLVGTCGEFEE